MSRRSFPILPLLIGLCATPALAETQDQALRILLSPAPVPLLSYTTIGRATALSPADIREVEISESGGITDIFVRLHGDAVATLAQMSELAIGSPIVVQVCGTSLLEETVSARVESGTFYIPNTTALQAEALRAIWHGRATCTDYPPEVFPIAQ